MGSEISLVFLRHGILNYSIFIHACMDMWQYYRRSDLSLIMTFQ